MADQSIPPPPDGFRLLADVPPPPPGFKLLADIPPPPPGFRLVDGSAAPAMSVSVPGMELLGGAPPPPATFALDVPRYDKERRAREAEVAMRGKGSPFPEFLPVEPAAVRKMLTGAAKLAAGGSPTKAKDPREAAQGAADVISGAMESGASPVGLAAAGAPPAALILRGVAEGLISGRVARELLERSGAAPEYVNLGEAAATAAPVGARVVKVGLERATPRLVEIASERRIRREREAGQQPSTKGQQAKVEVIPPEQAGTPPPPPPGFTIIDVPTESPISGGALTPTPKRVARTKRVTTDAPENRVQPVEPEAGVASGRAGEPVAPPAPAPVEGAASGAREPAPVPVTEPIKVGASENAGTAESERIQRRQVLIEQKRLRPKRPKNPAAPAVGQPPVEVAEAAGQVVEPRMAEAPGTDAPADIDAPAAVAESEVSGEERAPTGILERLRDDGAAAQQSLRERGVTSGSSISMQEFLNPETVRDIARGISGDVASGALKLEDLGTRLTNEYGPKARLVAQRVWNEAQNILRPIEADEFSDHGPVFRKFWGNERAATDRLLEVRAGEAPGAIVDYRKGHPIDLVWHFAGDGPPDWNHGAGLAHIAAKHPKMVGRIQETINAANHAGEVEEWGTRRLYRAPNGDTVSIDTNFGGKRKRWVVTAVDEAKSPAAEGSMGVSATLGGAAGTTTPAPGEPPLGIPRSASGVNRIQALAERGADLIGDGHTTFASWRAAMRKEFPDARAGDLLQAWPRAKRSREEGGLLALRRSGGAGSQGFSAPPAPAISGQKYRPKMTYPELVREAEVVSARAGREKRPVLRVNGQAMDLVHRIQGAEGGGEALGATFTSGQAERLLRGVGQELRIARLKGNREAVARWETLRTALEENRAAARGGPLVLVQSGPDVTAAETASALQEELNHALQLEATGDLYGYHVDVPRFLGSPAGRRAADVVRAERPGIPDSAVAMEIGVRLMEPGRWEELGITEAEALDLADQYTDLLVERHGPEKVARVIDKVYDSFRRNRYGKASQGTLASRRRAGQEQPATDGQGEGGKGAGGVPRGLAADEPPLHARRLKDEGPRYKKETSRLQDAVNAFRSVRDRVQAEGPAGRELMRKIDRADTVGTVLAGKRVVRLEDSGLEALPREKRFGSAGSVLDVLEGRAQAQGDAGNVAAAIRAVLDETAAEAVAAGVTSKRWVTLRPDEPVPAGAKLTRWQQERRDAGQRVFLTYRRPFAKRRNFFPHVIPSSEALRTGQVRRDVLDNLVHTGAAPDVAAARTMLDEYRRFIDKGGRAKLTERYLIDSGRARDAAEARALMTRFRKRVIQRQGSLEYSRAVDLPFYDPDPLRVLPRWVAATSVRLAQVREFRQNNEELNKLLHRIEVTNGNVEFARAAIDRGLKMIREGNTEDERVGRFLMTLQGFKLSTSFIQNSTQGAINTFLHTHDIGLTARAVKAATTKPGRRFAAQSGASLDGMINEMVRSVGRDDSRLGRALEAYLKVGFTPTEKANRIVAANAGHLWATKMLDRLKKNSSDQFARQELEALGLKPDVLLRIGKVDGDAALVAGKAFADATQFRSRVWDMPDFATKSTLGKMLWQFKNYGYQQFRLAYRDSVGEMREGRWGRGVATLLILATVFPMTGEVISSVKSLLPGGRKRKVKGLERYVDDVAQSSALGIVFDALQAGAMRRGVETIVGPTLSSAGQWLNVAASAKSKEPVQNTTKAFVRATLSMFGGAGANVARLLYPEKEKMDPETRKLLR